MKIIVHSNTEPVEVIASCKNVTNYNGDPTELYYTKEYGWTDWMAIWDINPIPGYRMVVTLACVDR